MEKLDLIEKKLIEIESEINNDLFEKKEVEEKYRVERTIEDLNAIVKYIKEGREKWIKKIIEIFCILEEKIKIEKLKKQANDKDELEKIQKRIFNMKRALEKEFLNNPDILIDELKIEGRKIALNSSLQKAINGIGFKLLEKTRLGQREEVLYLLLRTFKAHEQKLPECLIDALKTKYDDGLFKSFIYTFLTPILGVQENKTQGGES